MNSEEAIFALKTLRDMHMGMVNDEALTMAIAALKKQEQVKPLNYQRLGKTKNYFGFCPICGEGANSYMAYCERCGQALNWEEDAE